MLNNLMVVDDFLDSIDEIRAVALGLDYPAIQGQFPGRNSLQRLNIDGLAEQVSLLVGEPVVPIDPPQSHAKCRLTLAADTGRGKVHIDHAYWSGILFLSRSEDCAGAPTSFATAALGPTAPRSTPPTSRRWAMTISMPFIAT